MANRTRSVFLTLILGFAGGVVFYFMTMPLPWILGSLVVVAGLSMSGKMTLDVPPRFRQAMIAVLGVMLGSGFSPSSMDYITQWGASLAIIPLLILSQIIVAQILLKFIMKANFATRFFGGASGGLLEMTLLSREYGADDKAVLVMHIIRITLIVALVPLWFRVFEGYVPEGINAFSGGLIDLGLVDAALLLGCAVGGYFGGAKFRLPAYALIGPFILSVALHATGVTTAQPPYVLLIVAQIVVGAGLGTRFTGYGMRQIRKLALKSTILTICLISISVGFAYMMHLYLGLPFYSLILAFMPGGVIEMSLIALALNIDVGFVAIHSIARAFLVVVLIPLFYPTLIALGKMISKSEEVK